MGPRTVWMLDPAAYDVVIHTWIRFRLVDAGVLPTCRGRRRVKGGKATLRHPWLRNPLGLSLPSRQIGAGIINPVQTPIWPLGNPGPRVMPTAA